MPQPVISIENLSKSYQLGTISTGSAIRDLKRWWAKKRGKPDPFLKIGEVDYGNHQGETIWALKDITFTVQQSEALGIIGSNGAGKSTLLKILAQVTAPTSGVVKVKGRIASLLEVGTGFHAELTGRENIYLNGAINGMSRSEVNRKFDEIVDFSGVEKFIDTPIKRYSSGMYVRLAFAVAAHLDPEILIVDEVLAVGDLRFQKKCLGRMQEVANGGRTVLFVSHAMDSVRKLCGRCILLSSGHLVEMGDTNTIIASYLKLSTDKEDVSRWIRKSSDAWKGHQEFIPTELSLESDDGSPISSVVGSSQTIWVKIVGEIKELQTNLVIGFALYDSNGALLFESYQADVEESKWPELKVGENAIRAPLPIILLNSGRYRIQLQCALHQMHWIIAPGTGPDVSFELVMDHSKSPYFGFNKRGMIVPTLQWEQIR